MIFKRLSEIVVVIFAVVFASLFAVFFTDFGRSFFVDFAVKRLEQKNIVLQINGTNSGLKKINTVAVHLPNGDGLIAKNASVTTNGFRVSISVGELVLKSSDSSGKSSIGSISRVLSMLRLFIKNLHIENIKLDNGKKVYAINNLLYASDDAMDTLRIEIDDRQFADVALEKSNLQQCHAEFEIFGFDGDLRIETNVHGVSKYALQAENDKISVTSEGEFENFEKEIRIRNLRLTHQNEHYDLSGKLSPDNLHLDLTGEVSLDNLLTSLPKTVAEHFEAVSAGVHVSGDLENGHNIKINFLKDQCNVGAALINLKDGRLQASADFGWINIFGYNPHKIILRSVDFKNFDLLASGDDVEVVSHFAFGEDISVESFKLSVPNGQLYSVSPFVLNSDDMDCKFSFNFDDLRFLKKPIKGRTSGKITVLKNRVNISAKVPQLTIEDIELYDGNINGSADNLKLTVANLRCGDLSFKDFVADKIRDAVTIRSKLTNASTLDLRGNFIDNRWHITGSVKNRSDTLVLDQCLLDFKRNIFKISTQSLHLPKRTKKRKVRHTAKTLGKMDFNLTENSVDLAFKNFSINIFEKLLNRSFPHCSIDGQLNLHPQGEYLVGEGNFKLAGMTPGGNVFDINLLKSQNGLRVSGKLNSRKDNISSEASLPVKIGKNWNILVARNLPIDISLLGHANLANLMNLPDDCDIKGNVKTNLKIRGSLNNPDITGDVHYTNAYIAVSGLVLKNGTISLHGEGDSLTVTEAFFKDFRGHKAELRGGGKLSFTGIVPDIDVNLNMKLNNFRLFDSDDFKLDISGNGRMFGQIGSMQISGKFKSPLCQLKYSDTGDNITEKYRDIVVENDPYLIKKDQTEEDVFTYDNIEVACSQVNFSGDIYDLNFAGDLTLLTHEKRAALSGILRLKDGRLDLFGKRMLFTKGEAKFLEQYPFDPDLKLSCYRNVESMKIILDVRNTPGNGISIDLHSRPNHPQDVILSHMMFGKSIRNLSVGEAAQLAHAAAGLSQRGHIFSVLNTFRNTGLVDSISFSTNEEMSSSLYRNTRSSSNNKISVKAGKYLNDNIFVSVNKKEEETSFDVDLSLNKNTSLKINTQGEIGISWKYRY